MQPATTQAHINGHDLCYRIRHGSDRGVLFLHGLGCSKESFEPAFEPGVFPDHLTLLAPDLLGHGASSHPPQHAYSLESHSESAVDLVRHLGLREVYVVGHSMGGAIGLLCARELPALAGFFSLEGNLIAQDCTMAKRVAKVGESDFVDKLFPLASDRFRCRGLPTDPPPNPLAFHRSACSLLAWSESGKLLPMLKELPSTKTYLYGGNNEQLSVLRHLDGVIVVRIDGSGHFMMLERPLETYAAIVERL